MFIFQTYRHNKIKKFKTENDIKVFVNMYLTEYSNLISINGFKTFDVNLAQRITPKELINYYETMEVVNEKTIQKRFKKRIKRYIKKHNK